METAKLKLKEDPIKHDKSWQVHFINGIECAIPKSCISGYLPATKTIEIETWILIQKRIPFKLS